MNEKSGNQIVVLGNKIDTTIEEIDIHLLKYWKENPRVNAIINQKYKNKEISDQIIELELWEKDTVKDLFKDIELHGGLIDEILVKENIVLEGNSRLCAYRHLYNRSKDKNEISEMEKWSHIRSRILPADTSIEIVLSILGTWHIKGKAQWDTFEKAAYLKRMNSDYHHSYKQIADSISQTEKFVKDNIEAHDLMVENNVYTLEKFSYFYELVKYKNNYKYSATFIKEPQIINRVVETITSDGKMKRAEDIRNLPKILSDPKAKKLYIANEADFYDAIEISKSKHPELEDSFYSQLKKTTKLLQDCSVERIEEISKEAQKKYLLNSLRKEVTNICKKAGINNGRN